MSKKLSTVYGLLMAVSILLIFLLFYFIYQLKSSRPRVAFVRSLELVYGYNGMKEARDEFQQQHTIWQANIDTLKNSFNSKVYIYQSSRSKLNAKEIKEKEIELDGLKRDLDKYTSVVNDQAAQKEKELTQSILNQVNSFVQDYSKKHGYDMVFGAEGSGVILYGSEAYDITSEVLVLLNQGYKMMPKENRLQTTDSSK